MANYHHARPNSRRPHAQKTKPEDRANNAEIERKRKYIEDVRRTGIHWQHHIERLENKYPNSMLSVYSELARDVAANKAKKAAQKAKAEAKKERKRKQLTPPTSSNGSGSSGSSSSSESGQTFQSTELTQAMLERARGRPRKQSRKPSRLSHASGRTQQAPRQRSEMPRFRFSDGASSANDNGLTTDTSYEHVNLTAHADFFAAPTLSKAKETKREATYISSGSDKPTKRVKLTMQNKYRTTAAEASSEPGEPWGIPNDFVYGEAFDRYDKPLRRKTSPPSKGSAQPVHAAVATAKKAGMPVSGSGPSASPRKEQTSSQTSISAAFDDLFNEDGSARDYVPIESEQNYIISNRPLADRIISTRADSHGNGNGNACDRGPIHVQGVHEGQSATRKDLFNSTNAPASTTSSSFWTELPTAPAAGPTLRPPSISEHSAIDPAIASMIRKPDALARFLDNCSSALQSGQVTFPDPSTSTSLPTAGPSVGPSSSVSNITGEAAQVSPTDIGSSDRSSAAASGVSDVPAESTVINSTAFPGPTISSANRPIPAAKTQDLPTKTALPPPATAPNVTDGQSEASGSRSLPGLNGYAADPKGEGPKLDQQSVRRLQEVNCTVDSMKISPTIIRVLLDNAFVTISDLAQARMTKDDIRLLVASIQEEQKLTKSETIVAILRLSAALQSYKEVLKA